jgi:hypothetical protein
MQGTRWGRGDARAVINGEALITADRLEVAVAA